jgi:hypothetical protein
MLPSESPTKAVASSSATPSSKPANAPTDSMKVSTPETDQRGYFEYNPLKHLSREERIKIALGRFA